MRLKNIWALLSSLLTVETYLSALETVERLTTYLIKDESEINSRRIDGFANNKFRA